MVFESSERYREALRSFPEHVKPNFSQLVEECAFQTYIKYGKGYVAYEVLAEMVRNGWTPPPGTSRRE